MWKGGTNALWRLGDGATAAPLFARYGDAAKTPLTKAKGYYWAGRAAQRAGDAAGAAEPSSPGKRIVQSLTQTS